MTTSRFYDTNGNLVRLIDPRGNSTYFSYSYQNAYLTRKSQTLIPGGTTITESFSYNFTMGTLLSKVDPNGYNTTYQYDVLGRPTRVTYLNGNFVAYSYNDASNYLNTTNENGWLTQQQYDGLARLTAVNRVLNGKLYSNSTNTYNWQYKTVTTRDPVGNMYNYSYDALGRLTSSTTPDGKSTVQFYNDSASWVRTTNQDGNFACNFYDRLGRLISVVEYADSSCNPKTLNLLTYVTNYYYDEVGNLRTVTNAATKSTTYSYDNLNRPTITGYPDGTYESYSYDNNGNPVQKTDRKSIQTSYSYDSLNRPSTITYHGPTVTSDQYSYDKNGNLLQLVSLNATLAYTYDLRNRVVCEVYFVNSATTAGGPCGNGGGGGSVAAGTLITLANRTQVPVQNLHAGMSLLSYNVTTGQYAVSTITSLVTVETSNMLIIRTTDPLPLMVDNATAQKLWIRQTDGTVSWLSVTQLRAGDSLFNALDHQWAQVRSIQKASSGLHTMFDIYNTAPFDYIANGYLDPPKSPTGSSTSSGTLQSGYSVSHYYTGEVQSSLTYNDFMVESFSYDGLGRVASYNISQPTSVISYASFSYYRNDELMGFTYGVNPVTRTANYTYDALSRVKTITVSSSLLSLTYQYNVTGTVASVTGWVTNTGNNKPTQITVNEQYRYDPLQRLTNSTVTSGSTKTTLWYAYDNVGNRVRQSVNNVLTSYTYNSANNELVFSSGGNKVAYSYYLDGSLKTQNNTSTGTNWTYTWDVPDHLLSVANGAGAQGYYAYDGLGRRVEAHEGSSIIYFAYIGSETMLEHPTTGDTDYVYAGGMRIAKVTGYGGPSPTANYYITDILGSTRLITDSSAKVLFYDNYQPYGQDNLAGGSETYRFTGKAYSAATGLYYDYQRWYDPSTGRFISQDSFPGSISNPQSLNPYVYVQNTPTTLTDPTGLFEQGGFCQQEDCGIDPLGDAVSTDEFWGRLESSSSDPGISDTATTGPSTIEENQNTPTPGPTLENNPNIGESQRTGGTLPNDIGNGRQAQVVYEDYIDQGVNPKTIGVEEVVKSPTTGKFFRADILTENTATEVKARYVYGTDAKLQIRNQYDISRENGLQYRYVTYGRISDPVKRLLSLLGIPFEER
jgi:RHS repeat-associated protein